MYRYSMLLGLCLAMAAGVMAPIGAAGARTDAAMLKRIGSRLDGRTGVIAIEASTPVPYVASQPDARTFVVELRDVVTAGFEDGFTADPRHPIRGREGGEHAVVRRQRSGARAPDAQSADAAPRSQCAQRDLRRSRSRGRAAERRGRHDQPCRAVGRHPRRPRRQAGQRHRVDAARDVAPRHHEHSGAEGRHAATCAGHAERDLVAAECHLDQAGSGRSGADWRQSQVAAVDADYGRSDARGRVSRRVLAGRQRSHDRLRRARRRSDRGAQDTCGPGVAAGPACRRPAGCARGAAGPGRAGCRAAAGRRAAAAAIYGQRR